MKPFALCFTELAIMLLTGTKKVPIHWFNWVTQTFQGQLQRISIYEGYLGHILLHSNWIKLSHQTGCTPVIFCVEDDLDMHNWSDETLDEMGNLDFVCLKLQRNADEQRALIDLVEFPDSYLLSQIKWLWLGARRTCQKAVSPPAFWHAYAVGFEAWLRTDGFIDRMDALAAPNYSWWRAEVQLDCNDFHLPESLNTTQLTNAFFPCKWCPAAGIGFRNGQSATFGALPQDWVFDQSGELRKYLIKLQNTAT